MTNAAPRSARASRGPASCRRGAIRMHAATPHRAAATRSAETAAPPAAERAARTLHSFVIPAASAARPFDRRAVLLRFDAALLRRPRRPRRDAPLRHVHRGADQLGKTLARIVAVLSLVAKPVRLDDEHALGRQ